MIESIYGMTNASARPILLIGSVGLRSADEVFLEAGTRIGTHAHSIPDGETGERLKWVGYFSEQLASVPGLELASEVNFGGAVPQTLRFYRPREGISLDEIDLGSPGYAEIAAESYQAFRHAREQGSIPNGVRFQVSLPTPLVLSSFIQQPFEMRLAFVERIMLRELDEMVRTIPADDLAIQWDAALETESEEARRHPEYAPPFLRPDWPFDSMVAALCRLANAVPASVNLGFHLCYGNPDGKHLIEPADAGVMRDIVNALSRTVDRRIDWIHMPVPIARDDDAFFSPFDTLDVSADTQLYLGVVHEQDGLDGAARRLRAAERHLDRRVGIATECGMGRRRAEHIPALLDLHRQIAEQS